MRKLLMGSLLVMVLVVFAAAPALAQVRDPFDPVISQAELTGTETGTQTGTEVGTNGDGATVVGENGSETLANTGANTEPWLVGAYMLIAIGAGAVVISKVARQPL